MLAIAVKPFFRKVGCGGQGEPNALASALSALGFGNGIEEATEGTESTEQETDRFCLVLVLVLVLSKAVLAES